MTSTQNNGDWVEILIAFVLSQEIFRCEGVVKQYLVTDAQTGNPP